MAPPSTRKNNKKTRKQTKKKKEAKKSPFDSICDDAILEVFSYFKHIDELAPLREVCHRWNNLASIKFAHLCRTALTVILTHKWDDEFSDVMPSREVLYFTDDLVAHCEFMNVEGAESLEYEETIGDVVSIKQHHTASFANALKMFVQNRLSPDNDWTLMIKAQTNKSRRLTHIMAAVAMLVKAAPANLSRLIVCVMVDDTTEEKPVEMRQVCAALRGKLNLRALELRIVKYDETQVDLQFLNFDLNQVAQRLERFALGNVHVNIANLLRTARRLKCLKIDCHLDVNVDPFVLLIRRSAFLRKKLTDLTLRFPTIATLDFVGDNLKALKSLKLMSNTFQNNVPFDHNMILALRKLPHLTHLTLLDYDFLSGHPQNLSPQFLSLPKVTHLTLHSDFDGELFRDFIQFDHEYSVDLILFCDALFEQFPHLQCLTLIGPVWQPVETRIRLQSVLGDRLQKLNIFLADTNQRDIVVEVEPIRRKSKCAYFYSFLCKLAFLSVFPLIYYLAHPSVMFIIAAIDILQLYLLRNEIDWDNFW